MITGVSIGFSTQLEMIGVGYKAEVLKDSNSLALKLGFSHSIELNIPDYVEVSVIKTNKSDLIVISELITKP